MEWNERYSRMLEAYVAKHDVTTGFLTSHWTRTFDLEEAHLLSGCVSAYSDGVTREEVKRDLEAVVEKLAFYERRGIVPQQSEIAVLRSYWVKALGMIARVTALSAEDYIRADREFSLFAYEEVIRHFLREKQAKEDS